MIWPMSWVASCCSVSGDEFRVTAGGSLLDLVFENGLDLFLGAVHFIVVEAEALHPLELGIVLLETAQDVVLLQGHAAHDGVDVFIVEALDTEDAIDVRAVGLGSDVGETLPHDEWQQGLEDILRQAQDGGIVAFGGRFAVPGHLDGRVGRLGIGDDAHARLVMVRDGQALLRLGVLALGDDGEDLLNLGLGAVYIHVADDDNRLHVRMIPSLVEVGEALGLEGLQALLAAEYRAVCHLRSLEIIGEGFLHGASLGVAPLAAFFDDDAALLVDFNGIVVDEVRIVAKDHQAGVHDRLALDRDVVEHVLGFLEAGGGVHVPAEFGADGTEVVKDTLVGEVRRAVEAHVFEEVGETVLVRRFLDGADVRGEVELRPFFRNLVVTDIIGKTVFQMAHTDRRIVGKLRKRRHLGLLGGLREGHSGRQRERCESDEESFHITKIEYFY